MVLQSARLQGSVKKKKHLPAHLENAPLLPKQQPLTIITDASETIAHFFTSFIMSDATEDDVLDPSHTLYKQTLAQLLEYLALYIC